MNVTHWKSRLERPVYTGADAEFNMSDTAWHLVTALLTHRDRRLGRESAQQVRSHPFLADINFATLRDQRPPYVPHLSSDVDTAYFDDFEKPEVVQMYEQARGKKVRSALERGRMQNEGEIAHAGACLFFLCSASDFCVCVWLHYVGRLDIRRVPRIDEDAHGRLFERPRSAGAFVCWLYLSPCVRGRTRL